MLEDRRCSLDKTVSKIAIVGGTHGNELHGIYLVREFQELKAKNELQRRFPTTEVEMFIANPEAVTALGTGSGRRYIDKDLNRCFFTNDLVQGKTDEFNSSIYEVNRAKILDELLGPKSSPNPNFDFIIDLHSTTSNTGILILCHPNDVFSISLAAELQKQYKEISICLWSNLDVPLLPSISRSGITLEVGPIAHSTAIASLYTITKNILFDLLLLLDMHNRYYLVVGVSSSYTADVSVDVFKRYCSIGYPRDTQHQRTIGFVHPTIQGINELQPNSYIENNTPLLQLFDQTYLTLDTCKSLCKIEYAQLTQEEANEAQESFLYPNFVNEAAYYEKDIALNLTWKKTILVCQFKHPEEQEN